MSFDIPNLIAGFLISLVPGLIVASKRLFESVTSPAFKKYRGTFWLYHWSGTKEVLREVELIFSISMRGITVCEIPFDKATSLRYKGELSRSVGSIMYIEFHGVGHREPLFLTFFDALHPEFILTSGLISSINLNNQPTAWKAILSRSRLPESEAIKALGPKQLLIPEVIPHEKQGFLM